MMKLSSLTLSIVLFAGTSAFAQTTGAADSTAPATGSIGSANMTPSGSANGVNSPTGTTTGTGVGVTNNADPRIRTFAHRGMSSGSTPGMAHRTR